MSKWPQTMPEDSLCPQCEAVEHRGPRVVPYDLARELYEALGKIAEKGDQVINGTIVVVEDREANECALIAQTARARYEQEVGDG